MAGEPNHKTIVVGVDGSPPSVAALRWAAEQAELTGAAVEVITTWEFPTSYGWVPAFPPDFDPAADTARQLAETVRIALGERPAVEVRTTVLEGHAALALADASKGAALLVVGSRGHGAFAGMLLGSVSEYCVAHASCPVVVVRGGDPD